MESIAKPLRRMQEEGAWFARARELRLLWIYTQAPLRTLAMKSAAQLEFHADNRSPFISLEASWSGAGLGARARAEGFSERFAAKAEALRRAGLDVGPFVLEAPDDSPLATFGRQLTAACAALRPPLSGSCVVLSPARVDDARAFVAELQALVFAPELDAVRWIVIETDSLHLAPLVQELGQRALSVDFRLDEREQQGDLAALAGPLPEAGAAPTLPFPWGPWSSRGAMPRTVPPPRRDDRPAPSDDQLRAGGLEPAYLKGGAQALQQLMLHGALALRQGRTLDALELQSRTASLCGSLQLYREQVIHLLVLGSYQLAAERPDHARRSYQRAAELAEEKQLLLEQAQAELGLGMLDAGTQSPEAAKHYAAAGRLSEQAQTVPLAIECWRMAGQCAHDHQAIDWAIECWRHALELAAALDPAQLRATSAADIARLLANLLALRGQGAEAEELHRQAFRFEHGVEPEPLAGVAG